MENPKKRKTFSGSSVMPKSPAIRLRLHDKAGGGISEVLPGE